MMMTQYDDLNLLDDWLLRQAIEQAERRVPIDEELVPESVAQLGRVYIHLYVQTIFEGEVGNGGLHQFFENSSGALAPIVRDALEQMNLSDYANIMGELVTALGPEYPFDQSARLVKMQSNPAFQEMLDRGYQAIDVWTEEFCLARAKYARDNGVVK
ncbi:DUF4375 domain-containing protein [Rhizobium leguminosarum]|nr:DUF4375 domain-containing protein [Rhizobium leguminosarum]TBF40799.1 DUF4375 domain-containing protein [Rhizobium leguminosarum]TBF52348.1 DUF4375 domain-containing protein [Rhizobium leguminosarum]TBF57050.1 DUF4375 domain-containing protein [Rhizobium leguminosarum]TBF61719.1 DUF4375 domain-containing protein [Rhizobium leguminosarum]